MFFQTSVCDSSSFTYKSGKFEKQFGGLKLGDHLYHIIPKDRKYYRDWNFYLLWIKQNEQENRQYTVWFNSHKPSCQSYRIPSESPLSIWEVPRVLAISTEEDICPLHPSFMKEFNRIHLNFQTWIWLYFVRTQRCFFDMIRIYFYTTQNIS